MIGGSMHILQRPIPVAVSLPLICPKRESNRMNSTPTLHAAARLLCLAVFVCGALLPSAPLTAAPLRPVLPAQEPAPADPGALPAQDAAATAYPLEGAGLPFEGPLLIDANLPGAHSVQAADFDRDGDLDLVAAERNTGRLLWYRSSSGANPSFEPRPIATVQFAYMALATDLNRDGRVDIVLATVGAVDSDEPPADGSGSIIWFVNDGATPVPNFARRTLAAGLNYPVHIAAGDLDGNGTPDIAVASTADDTIRWFANGGGADPGFTPHMVAGGAAGAVAVDLADMDADGDLDVVAASEDDDRIVWHANDGAGTFSPNLVRPGAPGLPEFDYAKSVKAADLDGDGDLDIAYGSEDGNEVGWYQNNGQSPPQFTQRVVATGRNHVKFVTVADFDQDGDIDLFSASSEDGTFAWHRNDGAPTPTFTSFALTNAAMGARYVFLADIDDDGDLDVLAAARASGQILWFRNRTPHRTALYPAAGQRVVTTNTRMRHMVSGDLDGDGDLDLVTIADSDLVYHLNDGKVPAQFTPFPIPETIEGGRWIDLGDADNDGDLDIVAASTANHRIFWYENNGQRPPQFAEHVLSFALLQPRAVLWGDLNNDGDLDAFAVSDGSENNGPSAFAWYENNGQSPASFTERIPDSSLGYARSIFGADIDRDGDLDLLVADQEYHAVYIYENVGGSPTQFQRRDLARGIDTIYGALHVHASDVDSDGDLDVLVASEFNARISLYENLDGAGRSFAYHVVDGAAPAVHSVVAGDADNDGDMDLFAAIEGANTIAWYENNGARPPQFTRRVIFEQAFVAHSIGAADVDGDGDTDILATARDSGHALLFENRGGQFRLGESGYSLQAGAQGSTLGVLTVRAQHLGRGADAPLEMATLEVRFEDGAGALLTAEGVAARVRSLSVYADTQANGRLDLGADHLLVTETRMDQAAGGRLTVPLTLAPPPVQVGPGGAVSLFVVADLTNACGPGSLRLTVRPTARTAVDSLAGRPLLGESMVALAATAPLPTVDAPRFLRINEIAANGPGDDWIEILNTGPYTVDLSGMYLTDDLQEPTKHRIADGITLKPYGYAVFIADSTFGPYHVGFGLSREGESVGLFDADGRLNRALDSTTFGSQPPDRTSGRLPDGGATWRLLAEPTPGGPNVLGGLQFHYYLPAISRSFGC